MKPKAQNEHEEGLLEYLEDIIGTSHYKAQIEEVGQSLETVNDERSSKFGRVRMVEREKNTMEGQKNEAESFLRAENDLVIKKNMLLQVNIFECQRQIDVLTDTLVRIRRFGLTRLFCLEPDQARNCAVQRQLQGERKGSRGP